MNLARIPRLLLALFLGGTLPSISATVTADFTSTTGIPVTAASYTATGNDVALSLGFAPPVGANLTVVKNTGLSFISGRFSNLAHRQTVDLSYGGKSYRFVANYFGGTGNDLVLHWAHHELVAWGNNAHGQLGDNGTSASGTPTAVTQNGPLAGTNAVSVATGGFHSLALSTDGKLAAWGANSSGQLGNGSTTNSYGPVNRDGALTGKTVVAVAAGVYHSIALCSDGTLAAWGANLSGQLGNGSTTSSSVPVLVDRSGVLKNKTVVAVAAGGVHSLVLCSDGTLAAWGLNSSGQLGNNSTTDRNVPVLVSRTGVLSGKTVIAVAAGSNHSLAVCSDGSVATWGFNSTGQLGNNSTTSSSVPVLVNQSGVLIGKTVISVAAGEAHSLALCSDGTLTAWGSNGIGELGNGSTTSSSVPLAVNQTGVLAGKTVIAVATGRAHNLALCSDGTLASWGYNNSGQLGNNSTTNRNTPVLVNRSGVLAGKALVSVSAGFENSLAVSSDGTVAAWGSNLFCQLGNNSTTDSAVPVLVSRSGALDSKTVLSKDAGRSHNLVLCSDGKLAAWGHNHYGQLGNRGTTHTSVPVFVNQSGVLAGKTVISIATGDDYSLALCSDGTLASWGRGTLGQLGNNAMSDTAVPVLVARQSGVLSGRTVVAMAAGSFHSLALCSDGLLVAWGQNNYGQLGNSSTTNSSVPVLVNQSGALAGKSVIFIAAGGDHSLALCSDGTLAAWGRNDHGQLGNGSTTNSSVPVLVNQNGVLAGKTLVAITAGGNQTADTDPNGVINLFGSYSIGLCMDGTLVAWGNNTYGQLGNGSTTNSSVPVLVNQNGVLAGKTVVDVMAGNNQVMALCTDGTFATWGGNAYGQLGNNSTTGSSVPVLVDRSGVLKNNNVVSASAGKYHSFALASFSNSPDLSGLSLVSESLNPSFDPTVTTYTASVLSGVSFIAVIPAAEVDGAVIRVNEITVESGSGTLVPLSVGSNTITIVVTALDGVTTKTYTLIVTREGSYALWKEKFFSLSDQSDPSVSSELAIPAGDGITNLMKYALRLAPLSNGLGGLPTLSSDSGYLTLTYRKNKQATDLSFTVQAGSDLEEDSWDAVTEVVSQSDEGDHWLVTVRDNVLQASQTTRFMRLKVTK
jgi:alpha-tubulin suppressor-like RCC1 family protein